MCWRQDAEACYSTPGLSVDLWPQMCSPVTVAGVISAALIPQVPMLHNRRPASARLNCSELLSPGCCSRFRHLLSEGRDYGSTYGYSYIILHRCCYNAKNSSEMTISFHCHISILACMISLWTEWALSNSTLVFIQVHSNSDKERQRSPVSW